MRNVFRITANVLRLGDREVLPSRCYKLAAYKNLNYGSKKR